MNEQKYILKVVCRGQAKGMAVEAKRTFMDHVSVEGNPVSSAKFLSPPSSKEFALEVGVIDKAMPKYLQEVLEKSKRMPSNAGLFRVAEVVLHQPEQDRIISLESTIKSLEEARTAAHKQLEELKDRNARLEKRLSNANTITSPVEGILAYFKSLNFEPTSQFGESVDKGFIRKVFNKNIENTLENYVSYVTGEEYTKERIEEVLNYSAEKVEQELEEEAEKFKVATEQLKFLDKLQNGRVRVPDSLIEEYIRVITSQNHEKTIEEYEVKRKECDVIGVLKGTLTSLKEEYDSFADMIDLLNEVSQKLPILFNKSKESLEIYLPFKRTIQAGFIEDLKSDLENYFIGAEVSYKSNGSLMYEINANARQVQEGFNKLIHEVPFTLRIAGYDSLQAIVLED